MNSGRFVLSQLLDLIHRQTLDRLVDRYDAASQIWIAVTVYLLVAITHKQLKPPGNLHRTLQLLSIHPFEKTPLHVLLTETNSGVFDAEKHNQLMFNNL